jgi:Adenylylsulphate kinase
MTDLGFTVWVAGPDADAVEEVAAELYGRLQARHVEVELLDRRTPGVAALAGDGVERRVAFVAGALARHGVATVIALPAPTRAAREQARTELERMVEVAVVPARVAAAAGWEPPERAEVEVRLADEPVATGAERALRTLEVLGYLPRADQGYSEEEEREVIRRLKAFGYL